MTVYEQIEQLEMEKRVLCTEVMRARNQLRKVCDALWGRPDYAALRDETEKLYIELTP